MQHLDSNFWNERYLSEQTGWDLGGVSPGIRSYIDQLDNKHLRILIPGSGNSYEAEYLDSCGFEQVTVIDIAPTLTERLKKKWADRNIQVVLGDFFAHDGQYDLILEQTFFCAIDPALRPQYAQKMYKLLAPGGRLAGVLFNREFDKAGPPFGGSAEEYKHLFNPYFKFNIFEENRNAHPARQGNELFMELVKKDAGETVAH